MSKCLYVFYNFSTQQSYKLDWFFISFYVFFASYNFNVICSFVLINKGTSLPFLDLSLEVELERFELSSKQAIRKLSTCLFCLWFSSASRGQTPNLRLIFCGFRSRAEDSRNLFSHFLCLVLKRRETELLRDILFPYYTSGKVLILLNFRLSSKSILFVAS